MAAKPAGGKAKNAAQQYLHDFINEVDPAGTPPQVALKNRHARVRAAGQLAAMQQRDADMASRAAQQANQQSSRAAQQANQQSSRAAQQANQAANRAAQQANQAANRAAQQANQQANIAANRAAQQANQDANRLRRRADETAEAIGESVTGVAQAVGGAAQDVAQSTTGWLASLPTPGSIGLVLLALLFFVWAVIPVGQNGETRLQLLWYTLTGKTRIAGAPPTGQAGTQTAQVQPNMQTSFNPIAGAGSLFGGASGVTGGSGNGNTPPPVTSASLFTTGFGATPAPNLKPLTINPNDQQFTPDFGVY